MTSGNLKAFVKATPFRPFYVKMADGLVHTFQHPELIALGPDVILATGGVALRPLAQATRTSVRSSPAPQADTPAASTVQSPAGAPPTAEAPRTYPLEENRQP